MNELANRNFGRTVALWLAAFLASAAACADYEPPLEVGLADLVAASNDILNRPDIPVRGEQGYIEDIIRFEAAGMQWDVGMSVHEPADPANIATGADGKKIGIFLLHGGSGDFKSMHRQARILSHKLGYKVVSMSYPGRHAFHTESRDWPGKNVNDDGSVRTPIWLRGEEIGRDEYEVIFDTGQRPRYGTRRLAKAKPGTNFYYRMAAWPLALEAGGIAAMTKHFPADEYSIYVHGHSTGGPLVNMLSQRVSNVAGVLAIENSPFGYIYRQQAAWGGQLGKIGEYDVPSETILLPSRSDPFDELYIRSWRDSARYVGPELLGSEGPQALMRLPMVMEDILSSLKIVLSLHFLRQLGISAPHSQHRVHLGLQQPPVQHQALTFDWWDRQARQRHLCVGGWRFDTVLNGAQFVTMPLEVKMPRWCAGSFR